MIPEKFIYKCTDCDKEYSGAATMYLCPSCSTGNNDTSPPRGVLRTLYDYEKIRKRTGGYEDLKKGGFIELLPINDITSLPPLKIGNTPLYSFTEIGGKKLRFNLHLKDDSQNPTLSFKDRASALVSAYAMENNIDTIVTASTGNAGSSLAGICASQRQKAVIIVPESVRIAKLVQMLMYGAIVVPITGTYDDAYELSLKATEEFGWYNRNTAFNPLTTEGKKSVALELYEQLKFQLPDRIFVPTGDGVILAGVYKGFEDLLMLGLIERVPVVVAVQSSKSDNLVRNIGAQKFIVMKSATVAESISVDRPRNFYMAQYFIKKYNGETLTVTDDEILKATKYLSTGTGIFAEPAAVAGFAALMSYHNSGRLAPGSSNVVLITSTGLKDFVTLGTMLKVPAAIDPTIGNLKKKM